MLYQKVKQRKTEVAKAIEYAVYIKNSPQQDRWLSTTTATVRTVTIGLYSPKTFDIIQLTFLAALTPLSLTGALTAVIATPCGE